jgi:micrococcal nuclease
MSIIEFVFKTHRTILLKLTFGMTFLILTGCSKYEGVRKSLFPQYFKCDVVQVIGGDSFYCQFQRDREIEKIKLIGIEIPESVGEKTTRFAQSLLTRGTPVRIEQDVEGRDKHGRILAYVYPPGGTMLNALLIQEGYARVITVPPNFKYKDLFLNLQKQAKEQGKGLWGIK